MDDDTNPQGKELLLVELSRPLDAERARRAVGLLASDAWIPEPRAATTAQDWEGSRLLVSWVNPPDDPAEREASRARFEALLEPSRLALHPWRSHVRRTSDGVMWSGELPPQDAVPAFPVWGYPGVIGRLDWQDFGMRIFFRGKLEGDQILALRSLFDLWAATYRTPDGAAYRSRSFEVAADGESVLFWVDRFRQPGAAEEVVHHLLWVAARAAELLPVAAARFESAEMRAQASGRSPRPGDGGGEDDDPPGLRPSWAPVLLIVLFVLAAQLLASGRFEWALRSAFFLVGAISLTMLSRAWVGRVTFVMLAISALAQIALLVFVSVPPEQLFTLVGGPDPSTAPARVEAVLTTTSYLSLGTFLLWAVVYVRGGRRLPQ